MKPQRRPKALVIEDDPHFCELISLYLTSIGAAVEKIPEGKTAMKRLSQTVPDLICVDLMLPNYSGYEICEFVRRTPALRAVPVLFMSSRASPTDRAEAEDVGANAYLVKPFSREAFLAEVVGLLPALGKWLDPQK